MGVNEREEIEKNVGFFFQLMIFFTLFSNMLILERVNSPQRQ